MSKITEAMDKVVQARDNSGLNRTIAILNLAKCVIDDLDGDITKNHHIIVRLTAKEVDQLAKTISDYMKSIPVIE